MIDTLTCEHAGHMWLDAGGGMDICGVCHSERLSPEAARDEREREWVENPQHGAPTPTPEVDRTHGQKKLNSGEGR